MSKLIKIAGIDPGLRGAVAVFSEVGLVQVASTPVLKAKKRHHDIPRMVQLLRDAQIEHAFLEKVGSFPEQGVASSFNFGVGYGIWQGILSALEIPYTLVPPQRWHKMLAGTPAGTPKARARLYFSTHFPKAQRCLVSQIDAVLIGYWGARQIFSGDGFADSIRV